MSGMYVMIGYCTLNSIYPVQFTSIVKNCNKKKSGAISEHKFEIVLIKNIIDLC